MIRYSFAVFLSALLLFSIQPMTARCLLPHFGGTASVWTACIMFFQVALLAGYFYAHWMRKLFSPRTVFCIHTALLVAGYFSFDILPLRSNEISGSVAAEVFYRLVASVGLPFCLLAATAPLIQSWHSLSFDEETTYRLYAFSNIGSMSALVAYPFYVASLDLSDQTYFWSQLLLVFVLAMGAAGFQVFNINDWNPLQTANRMTGSWTMVLIWVFAAGTASALLIATTNILCQEVAAFPFLWVWPLILYLLSFIICFDRPAWYQRKIFIPLLMGAVFVSVVLLHLGTNAGLTLQVAGFGAIVFAGSMVCHGELYRARPGVEALTSYYLWISAGGVIGSVFCVLIAPRVFDHFFEFHLSILFCLAVTVILSARDFVSEKTPRVRLFYAIVFAAMVSAGPVLCSWYFLSSSQLQSGLIFRARNEYGIVSVRDHDGYRSMYNGQTNHGGQFLDEPRSSAPNAYYSTGSGADIAFRSIRSVNNDLDVCVIGLGTGSILSHRRSTDRFRFYEINELSLHAANKYFTYLKNSNAEVVIGDGRQKLEAENNEGHNYKFDLIFVDAFSSDSIPVHLLTQECIDLYLRNLAEEGILVFHVTNKFVDLLPVLKSIEYENQLVSLLVEHENDEFKLNTKWVLLSRRDRFQVDPNDNATREWDPNSNPVHWTDENSNVAPVVIWSPRLKFQKK